MPLAHMPRNACDAIARPEYFYKLPRHCGSAAAAASSGVFATGIADLESLTMPHDADADPRGYRDRIFFADDLFLRVSDENVIDSCDLLSLLMHSFWWPSQTGGTDGGHLLFLHNY
jgi:hypothetical protein